MALEGPAAKSRKCFRSAARGGILEAPDPADSLARRARHTFDFIMPRERSLVRHSRREAWITLSVWVVVTTYVVSYCYLNGYNRDPATIRFYFGFPDWLFWGLIVPWLGCLAFSICFAIWGIWDDEQVAASTDDEILGDDA